MSADEAEDWLRVAVGEVIDTPAWMLREASEEARRTCTHHSQIVPSLVAAIDKRKAESRWIAELTAPIPPALPPPRLSDEDFDAIVAERGFALSAMLDRGVIISNGNGTFRRADDAA